MKVKRLSVLIALSFCLVGSFLQGASHAAGGHSKPNCPRPAPKPSCQPGGPQGNKPECKTGAKPNCSPGWPQVNKPEYKPAPKPSCPPGGPQRGKPECQTAVKPNCQPGGKCNHQNVAKQRCHNHGAGQVCVVVGCGYGCDGAACSFCGGYPCTCDYLPPVEEQVCCHCRAQVVLVPVPQKVPSRKPITVTVQETVWQTVRESGVERVWNPHGNRWTTVHRSACRKIPNGTIWRTYLAQWDDDLRCYLYVDREGELHKVVR